MQDQVQHSGCPQIGLRLRKSPPPQGAVCTSVQPLETSVPHWLDTEGRGVPAWIQSRVQRFIHRAWMKDRQDLYTAFHLSGDERLARRADKLSLCCVSPVAVKLEGGAVQTRVMRCRDRLCPFCSIERSRKLGDQLSTAIKEMDDPRHLVLTAPAVPVDLRSQLDDLRRAFRTLRRGQLWKATQRGGVYSIEITRNRKTGLWHPHIHVVIDGEYLPHNSARDAWREALRTVPSWSDLAADSACIIHLERVGNRRRLGDYIGKYVAKPTELRDWPDHAICDYAEAMHGVRLVHAFGSLHGVSLADVPEPNKPPEPGKHVHVLTLIRKARTGCRTAIAVLFASAAHGQAWHTWSGLELPEVLARWVATLEADHEWWWSLAYALTYDLPGGVDDFERQHDPPPEPDPELWAG